MDILAYLKGLHKKMGLLFLPNPTLMFDEERVPKLYKKGDTSALYTGVSISTSFSR